MARNLSFRFLLLIVAGIGILFFQVIQPFVLSIFVAIILAVLFHPTHLWIQNRLSGRNRLAALLTTSIAILLVLLPISITLLMAGSQVMDTGKNVLSWVNDKPTEQIENTIEKMERTSIGRTLHDAYLKLPENLQSQIGSSATRLVEGGTSTLYDKTQGFIANLFMFIVGVCVMTLSLYYFLADRELFLDEFRKLLPLEWREERNLAERFQSLCRGVVFGTIAAGLAQAMFAGFAYAFIGVEQLWLLIVLTMLCSFIPFFGAAIVWFGVALFLLFDQQYAAAIGLTIYSVIVIGSVDNLVRAYVVGSQARLHPLIALVTVLGAIEMVGLWGIFLGPMVAAFLYALLNIVRERLERSESLAKADLGESQRVESTSGNALVLDHA
jgi:predicted PurR-regulated permease PerM